MPRTCTICSNPKRDEIDQALVDNATLRDIARQYGLSKDAVDRHKAQHLTAALTSAALRRDAEGDSLLERIHVAHARSENLYTSAEDILRRALKEKDNKLALRAVQSAVSVLGEARQWAALHGELTGELKGQLAAGPVEVNVIYREYPINQNDMAKELPPASSDFNG